MMAGRNLREAAVQLPGGQALVTPSVFDVKENGAAIPRRSKVDVQRLRPRLHLPRLLLDWEAELATWLAEWLALRKHWRRELLGKQLTWRRQRGRELMVEKAGARGMRSGG